MSRLVRIPKSTDAELAITGLDDVFADNPRQDGPVADNYLERIAKYVPGEVLAFFILINAILIRPFRPAAGPRPWPASR